MRSVTNASTSAASPVMARPIQTVSHGEIPCVTDRYAAVYAPMPTNAACPNEMSPVMPVSSTMPSTTSEYSPM